MKTDRQAQQIIEYLLLFAAVIAVIFAAARGIGESTERVLRGGLEGLQQSPFTYNWVPTDCGPCDVECGGGTQTCGVKCQRNDGTDVDDSFCEEPRPEDVIRPCNTQPCPIDCVWGDWQEGTCQPVCGYNRVRIDTRDISIPAQFGGQPCTGPSSMTVACEDLPCTGVCGNGVIEDSEQCDSPNLNGLNCSSSQIESLAGRTFTGGTLACYLPGSVGECLFDMSLCEYLECDEWVDGLCGEGECAPGQRNRTRQCRTMTLAGTVLDAYTDSECSDDVACMFSCSADRDLNSTKCDGADTAMSPDQAWTYVLEGTCPAPPASACMAQCPDTEHIIINAMGCSCEGFYSLVSGQCLCLPPAQEVYGAATVRMRIVTICFWIFCSETIHWDCTPGINITYAGNVVQADAGVASCAFPTHQGSSPNQNMVQCASGYSRVLLATADRGIMGLGEPNTTTALYLYGCQ